MNKNGNLSNDIISIMSNITESAIIFKTIAIISSLVKAAVVTEAIK